MKISKIIDELTEIKEYIGDREVEGCMANSAVTSVNILYLNDEGGYTSTSLEGEKEAIRMKATMSEQEKLGKLKVRVLDLVFCEASNDPELVARADVEVTNDGSVITLNGLDLRHNDSTGIYSIAEPELPSGVCINGFTCRAVTSAVAARYEQIKHSDEMLEKLDTATSIDRKEYDEFLKVIYEHFDRDDMDIADCLEECKLQLKAAHAYINYLEDANKIDNKDQINKLFTKMFESSIKSVVDDSLSKIETTCVTALDKFCQQMDSSAYDKR
jgi:hypothetical protein